MFGRTVRLDAELHRRVCRCATAAGYSSAGEFVRHVLEREVERLEAAGGDEGRLDERLRGLGYLA